MASDTRKQRAIDIATAGQSETTQLQPTDM